MSHGLVELADFCLPVLTHRTPPNFAARFLNLPRGFS